MEWVVEDRKCKKGRSELGQVICFWFLCPSCCGSLYVTLCGDLFQQPSSTGNIYLPTSICPTRLPYDPQCGELLLLNFRTRLEDVCRVNSVPLRIPLTIPNVWIGKHDGQGPSHRVWAKGGIQNRIEHQAPRLHLSNIETQRSRIVNRKGC